MYRLIHRSNVNAATDAKNDNNTVSIEKLEKLLSQVKQLRNHDISINTRNNGVVVLTIDGIVYETT